VDSVQGSPRDDLEIERVKLPEAVPSDLHEPSDPSAGALEVESTHPETDAFEIKRENPKTDVLEVEW
jgi:hypothetical protein